MALPCKLRRCYLGDRPSAEEKVKEGSMGQDGRRLRQGSGSFRTAQTKEAEEKQVNRRRVGHSFKSKRVDHGVPRRRRGWAVRRPGQHQPIPFGCPGQHEERGSFQSPILNLATSDCRSSVHLTYPFPSLSLILSCARLFIPGFLFQYNSPHASYAIKRASVLRSGSDVQPDSLLLIDIRTSNHTLIQ